MKRLARDVLLLAFATGISRVFGLFRDMTIADKFGASAAYDAFLIAFFLPHFLRQLLAEGALSTAFIPAYTDALVNDREANRLASNVLSLLVIIFPPVVAAGVFLAPYYLPFLASGFPSEKLRLSIHLAQILFPFIALVGFAAVFMGILNAHHRFLAAATAPVMFNLGMIAGALLISPRFAIPITGLAIGALIGGAGQLLFQVPAVVKSGFRFRFTLFPLHPGVLRMGWVMAPAVIGLAVTQLNLLVDNKLASYLGTGAISSLQYAMRLFQLPLGMFAVSIATALLPRFSRAVARADESLLRDQLRTGIEASALVLLPAMVGLYALGRPIIALLFQHGNFTATDTARTAQVLYCYLIGILPYGLVYTFTRAFYALGRTSYPLIASAGAVAANIVFDLLLVGPLGARGLALATSVSGITNATILFFALVNQIGPGRKTAASLGKIVLGCLLLYGVVLGVELGLAGWNLPGFVFIAIVTGAVVYVVYAKISGLDEIVTRLT